MKVTLVSELRNAGDMCLELSPVSGGEAEDLRVELLLGQRVEAVGLTGAAGEGRRERGSP